MSKKQLRNRLESLFSNLAEDGAPPEHSQPEIDQLSPAETAADEMLASAPQPDASTLTAPTIHSDPSNRIELTSPNGKATAGVPVQKNGRVKSNGTGKTGPLPTDPPASGGSNRNPTDTNHRPARQGFSLEQGSFQSAVHPWTETGARGLDKNELALMNATGESPAAIAMPLKTRDSGDLLIEIVDDSSDREWSEDDRFLVMEIASQLALALDNAQLYQSVQQELAEESALNRPFFAATKTFLR